MVQFLLEILELIFFVRFKQQEEENQIQVNREIMFALPLNLFFFVKQNWRK